MQLERLSDCEELVMAIIWKSPEALALSQIMERANEGRVAPWKPQTVSTFLARLARKGYLTTERKGRYTYYHPNIGIEEYRKLRMEEMVLLLFDGDIGAACECLDSMELVKS